MSVIKEVDSEQSLPDEKNNFAAFMDNMKNEPAPEKNNFATFMDNMNDKPVVEDDEDKDVFKKLPSIVKKVEKEDPKLNFGAFMDALKYEDEETKVEKEDPKLNFGAFMDALKTEGVEETKGEIAVSSFDKTVGVKVEKKSVNFG